MLVARVETFAVPPRWLFVRIETDDGLIGWGEATLEGSVEVVRRAIDLAAERIIGLDATRIEHVWQLLTRGAFYRGGPVTSSAVAGIDQALWDLAGKRLGQPVHVLLGGRVRDRVRMYGWVGGDDPSELEDAIARSVAAGLTAVKMNASGVMPMLGSPDSIEAVLRRAGIARSAAGGADVAIDFHGRFTPAQARAILPLLEPFHPLFVEEPVAPEFSAQLARIVDASRVPIATGERLYGSTEFLSVLQSGVAVVQPDLAHAGGISEVSRIAALASTFGALLAPHCPLGPLALAASLNVGLAAPNLLIQEQSLGIHYNIGADLYDYLLDTTPLRMLDGHILATTLPGLGIDIDERAVRAADDNADGWRSPVWTHPDGSWAEW